MAGQDMFDPVFVKRCGELVENVVRVSQGFCHKVDISKEDFCVGDILSVSLWKPDGSWNHSFFLQGCLNKRNRCCKSTEVMRIAGPKGILVEKDSKRFCQLPVKNLYRSSPEGAMHVFKLNVTHEQFMKAVNEEMEHAELSEDIKYGKDYNCHAFDCNVIARLRKCAESARDTNH